MTSLGRAHRPASIVLSALFLWLTGVACLVACGRPNLSAAVTVVRATSNGAHDCCAKGGCSNESSPQAGAADRYVARTSVHPRACPLLAGYGKGDAPRETRNTVSVAAALATAIVEVRSGATSVRPPPAARLPDRQDTYLRCCVFLI